MKNNRLIALDALLSPKLEKIKLDHEWEQFISGNKANPEIRSLMYDSWKRCLTEGVNPFQRKTAINLRQEQIEEYLLTDPYFRLIRPLLMKLKDVSADSNHLMTFCNSFGDIVYLDGDLSLMLKAEDMNFVVGSTWAENKAGTNAIGTALATGSPIQVFAGEHFCQEVQQWTCSAAPIRDPATQKVLGVIDLTGLWKANHPYSLSTVISTAQAAEGLLRNQLELDWFKLMEYYQSISRKSTSPVLVMDRGCKVIKASAIFYEQGWIDSNQRLVGAPSLSFPILSKIHWEAEQRKGIWRFELTPYIYGGIPIGATVLAIPPSSILSRATEFSFSALSVVDKSNEAPPTEKEEIAMKDFIRSEQFTKSFFEHHPDGIYSLDLQGNLLSANPAVERITGYSFDELRRLTIQGLILPEDSEKRLQHFIYTTKGNPQEYEVAIRHKNGHRVDVRVQSFPIFIDYEIVGVYGILKDITKYKQIEEDLKSTKEQLEMFSKNTVDSIVIFDRQLNVIKVNSAFERIFGWTEQEVIGGPLPTIPDSLTEEFMKLSREILHSRHVTSYETVRQCKNGSMVDVNVFISPILDTKGNVVAFVSSLRDITDRKRMEDALNESEKQLRTLINAMPDLVLFKDGEGRWMEANDYVLSILQLENVSYKGKKNGELAEIKEFYRDVLLSCDKSDLEAWEAGQAIRGVEVIPQPDGASIVFDVIKVPIFHPDGRPKALVNLGRDITELKKTEELLRKSEKLAVVGQLSAGIAHEIRNPLTTLKGFLKLLESKTNKNDLWYLDVMSSEINRIQWITEQFMTVSKPQIVKYQQKDLQMLMEQIITFLNPQATMNNVQITMESESGLPLIDCEENQLKQVFINILKNAIESMPSGGQISVKVRKLDQNLVLIRCIDQGCGIPKDRLRHLGEPFYSLKEKGTGLGLMICYKIIEEHHGKIIIESEINKGTIVDIILPIK